MVSANLLLHEEIFLTIQSKSQAAITSDLKMIAVLMINLAFIRQASILPKNKQRST
jgi:hypothetical protein